MERVLQKRKPVKRSYREIVSATIVDRKPFSKVIERVKPLALVFPAVALALSAVFRRIEFNARVPYKTP